MLIAKLSISYDRGTALNKTKDLEAENSGTRAAALLIAGRGHKTADGKVIRGIGSHFRSEADAELVRQRDAAAREIYTAFRGRFLAAPIEGLYFVPQFGEAKKFINSLDVRADMDVRVSEFELSAPSDLAQAEMAAWSQRIKNQLGAISLGRTKEADEDGLRSLEVLASCPVLTPETTERIKELVAGVRAQKLDRVELKRRIMTVNVEIEARALSPRRMPTLTPEEVA